MSVYLVERIEILIDGRAIALQATRDGWNSHSDGPGRLIDEALGQGDVDSVLLKDGCHVTTVKLWIRSPEDAGGTGHPFTLERQLRITPAGDVA